MLWRCGALIKKAEKEMVDKQEKVPNVENGKQKKKEEKNKEKRKC